MLRVGLSYSRLLYTFLVILIGFNSARAQNLAFRHYTVEDGLASATVYSSLQDNKGYLWFSTESGVNRFNGKKFELFTVDDGLADSEVFKIFQDSQNRIWFLTYNGQFSYFSDGKFFNGEHKTFLNEAFCGQTLTGVEEDKHGRLWFSSFGNYIILIDGEKVTKFNFPENSFGSGGVNVTILPDGNPEFRYSTRIFLYDAVRRQLKYHKTGKYDYYFQRSTSTETAIYTKIVREGIIINYGSKDELIIPQPPTENLAYFSTVYHESNNLLWVGTLNSGLFLYSLQNDTVKLLNNYLPEMQINSMSKDHEGNLWICTKEKGVYMLSEFGRHTVVYDESKKFPTKNVYSIFADSRDRIWTGGEKGIVSCLDSIGNVIQTYRFDDVKSNDYRITDIAEDSTGNIWVATSFNIHRIDKAGKVIGLAETNRSLQGPRSGKSIAVTKDGDVYLAFYAGIAKYNQSYNSFDLLEHQGFPNRTFCVFSFEDRLLVANINGLCEYKNDTLIPLYLADTRLRNRISCFRNMGDSTLLIATNGHGVYVYRNDKIVQHLNIENGLPSNDCRSLFVEGNDLWVATVKGLAKFHLRANRWVVRDITHTLTGIYSHDIREITFNDNKIYVASSIGLLVLDGTEFTNTLEGPPVLVLSMKANNIKLPLDSTIQLRYNQNNLSINFEAISFNNPGQIQYEYRITETDEKLEQTNANEIVLSWLPPGKYDVLIRAKIANGNWGPPALLQFIINKPFWDTFTFRVLLGFILIGLISMPFYLYYKQQIKNRWLELDKLTAVNKERQRISYDLHDDLGSSLTSIVMNAEIIKHKKVVDLNFNKELEDIILFSRDANEKMSDIVWAVSVSNDHLASLASYINEFISDFESRTGIQCIRKIQLNLEQLSVRPEARKNIFLTVKEAFHNIQKHAGATQVVFELFISNHILSISIKDNGKGFEETGIIDSSVGLTSMRKRMESISGEIIILTKPNLGTDVMIRFNVM